MPTKLKQKLLLIFLGILLAFVLLEIGLRITGAIVLFVQERRNHVSYASNEYRILCLGESTTALGAEDSYPSQLELMLNAAGQTKKFTVINKGLISTTSDYIIKHLDRNLDIYSPQMVILMMGVNDSTYLHEPAKALWLEDLKSTFRDLRVYKLMVLLYQHITHRINEPKAAQEDILLAQEGDHQQIENFLETLVTKLINQFKDHASALAKYKQNGQIAAARKEEQLTRESLLATSLATLQLAQRFRLAGRLLDAQKTLELASSLDPNDADIYQEWGELTLAQGKYSQAEQFFQTALGMGANKGDCLIGLARTFYQERKPEAFLIYARYLLINPQDYWGFVELAQWFRQAGRDDLAEKYLGQAIRTRPELDQAYADMAQLYRQDGKIELAKLFAQKAAQHDSYGFTSSTFVNDAIAVDKILNRNIKVIIMQYPLRDIGPLKEYLGEKKGLIFVENKQNFKEALAKQGYWYYFKDNFAYNFGHCTRAGNGLISRNLADVILKEISTSP